MESDFTELVPLSVLEERADSNMIVTSLSRSRSDSTMDAIKALVLRNNLKPGDSLPTESTLCKELGVSRSSVREAIRKLEALNIVSVEHGRGTFVGSLSLDPLVQTLTFRATLPGHGNFKALRDVVEVRRYIDLGCAEQVVSTFKGTQQPHLQQLVDQMIAQAEKKEMFLEQDIEFHLGLLSNLPNDIIKQLVQALWLVHMAVIPQIGLEIASELEPTAFAHQAILDAAIDGDINAYRKAVIAHYEFLEEILDSHLK